jgi:hypothetical protein
MGIQLHRMRNPHLVHWRSQLDDPLYLLGYAKHPIPLDLIQSLIFLAHTGWDVTFDGQVQGDMNVKFVLDDREMSFSPSDGSLFSIKDLDNLQKHSLSLTVQSASAGSLLSVNQARINASTFSDQL